jgi:TPR repeat protein
MVWELTKILLKGRGVEKNVVEAVIYFKMAADQGHFDAQFHYGWALRHGHGVQQDLTEAERYISMSRNQNSL